MCFTAGYKGKYSEGIQGVIRPLIIYLNHRILLPLC
jgi:hypothetical protein